MKKIPPTYATLLFPKTLITIPAQTRTTPIWKINSPFLSFLATSIILSLRVLEFAFSDNMDNHQHSRGQEEKHYSAMKIDAWHVLSFEMCELERNEADPLRARIFDASLSGRLINSKIYKQLALYKKDGVETLWAKEQYNRYLLCHSR